MERTLTTDLEAKMMMAIKKWRHAERRRHLELALLQAECDREFTKAGIFVDEPEYEDDGPAPSSGG